MPPSRSRPSLSRRLAAFLAGALLVGLWPVARIPPLAATPNPGGPLIVGGPSISISGVPFTWDPATMPIQYRVDPGPMAVAPSGDEVISNAAGIARVNAMFNIWSSVPTASLSFANAGALLPSGSYTGGPVASGNALENFNAVVASCDAGQQSPVVFDPNGNLLSQLGLSTSIIGFAGPCMVDSAAHILTAEIVMNGRFQDGVSSSSNFEISPELFDHAIAHEIGHFVGLDHSQVNVEVLSQQPLNCNSDDNAGLPLMFPVAFCQPRVPVLAPDDLAAISRLYPVTTPAPEKTITSSAYGTISGTVYFSDGLTQAQGVNVIARQVGNPRRVAFSSVSGYLFTGNLGQSVTCALGASQCNAGGSLLGPRDTRLVGTFDIPAAPETYTVQVESVNSSFVGGSGVGPLRFPIPMPGTAPPVQQVTVVAGGNVNVNITLLDTPPRFDAFESSDLILHDHLWFWLRRDNVFPEAVG